MTERIGKQQLLWIDVERSAREELVSAASALEISPELAARLATAGRDPDLTRYERYLHLVLHAVEPGESDALSITVVDIVGGRDWILTVHDGPAPALARFDAVTEGETQLGALDAAGFVADLAV